MKTLTRYASVSLLLHLAVALVLFVSLLQLLDLLSSAEDVMVWHGGSSAALLRHVLLRLPDLAAAALPFSVLVAALMVLAKLANNNEVLALKAAGVSYYGLLAAFLPAAVLVAGAYFLLSDQLAPAFSREFAAWNAEARLRTQAPPRDGEERGNWIRDGDTRVRVDAIADDGRRLLGVTLFICDEAGIEVRQVSAREARYAEERWTLFDAEQLEIGGAPGGDTTRAASLAWDTSLAPGQFADLWAPATTLGLTELMGFAAHPEQGNRPANVYETWMHKRLATPFTVFLMILLSAPVAQGFQRQRSLGLELAVGMGLGFLFFVTDGLLLALGEAGALPPALAAWAPMVLFASIGGATLVRMEGH